MALGGAVAAGWVALIGTTELREARGRVPWYGTAANHAGVVLPALVGGVIADLIRGSSTVAFVTVRFDDGRSRRALPPRTSSSHHLSLPIGRTNPCASWPWATGAESPATPWHSRHWRGSWRRCIRSAGGRRCCSPCPSTRHALPTTASSRCARCSRRPSGRWPRPWTSGIRSRASTATGSSRSRSTSARRCASDARSSRRSSGAACSTTSARSACRTTSC